MAITWRFNQETDRLIVSGNTFNIKTELRRLSFVWNPASAEWERFNWSSVDQRTRDYLLNELLKLSRIAQSREGQAQDLLDSLDYANDYDRNLNHDAIPTPPEPPDWRSLDPYPSTEERIFPDSSTAMKGLAERLERIIRKEVTAKVDEQLGIKSVAQTQWLKSQMYEAVQKMNSEILLNVRRVAEELLPKRIQMVRPDDTIIEFKGLKHKSFDKLALAVAARTRHDQGALNIWIFGPAGTGKSRAAIELAKGMNLPFHCNGPIGSQWDIRGFVDAQGRVTDTAFRRAWEGGGIYCWDEGDASSPAAILEANGALATGLAPFPDKIIERHKDCIVIITGNLRPGAAPDSTYNGRFKQDAAFVNRFIAIEWPHDDELENMLQGELNATGQAWLLQVRTIRKAVVTHGIKGIVVSSRQSQYGQALIDRGADIDTATEMTLKWMFTDDQWRKITDELKEVNRPVEAKKASNHAY